MKVWLALALLIGLLGCDGVPPERGGGKRRNRRERPPVVNPIVDPSLDAVGIEAAQRAQVKGRAAAMRQLATDTRSGASKTVWDINKSFRELDKLGRDAFEAVLAREMEKALSQKDSDNLPATAADSFDKFAKDFENVVK
jgi:hypothetical protein